MNTTYERKNPEQTSRRVEYVLPPVNIREEKDAYILEAEMPGVNKDSLEITLEGTELTLVGHRTQSPAPGEAWIKEQRQADFRRVFEVDPSIDGAGIKASMNQGLLILTLPKSERVKPRKIAVSG
ncbi:MAG: Hsp20/alpha crystallin family protein [Verrucomicrobia bacterium]|nr:Hsp20/alpha crystallin family protein [Verrucomicrobiota bacterium]